jgi:hypothetical protein
MRALRAAGRAVPPSLAALVAREVARGLHHAHTANLPGGVPARIVHRDVTPSNIMLLRAGGVKVLDFGIAKAAAEARQAETAGGRVRGKLAYLSPEQVRAGEVDGRSDVFALGVVLWEMLTGQRLFAGENEFQTMRNVLSAPVPPPSARAPGIAAALDEIVARALDRDRAGRYPTAQAMADDLERHLREAPCPSDAISALLAQLFGEDPGLPATAEPPPAPSPAESAGVVRAAAAAAPTAATVADDGASWTQAPPLRRTWRERGRAMAAGAALLACLGWAARARLQHHAVAQPLPVATATATATPTPASPPSAAPVVPPAAPTAIHAEPRADAEQPTVPDRAQAPRHHRAAASDHLTIDPFRHEER